MAVCFLPAGMAREEVDTRGGGKPAMETKSLSLFPICPQQDCRVSYSLNNDDNACVKMVSCIALAVYSVAKNSNIAITLEKLVNSIATHFNHSNKRLAELRITKEDLACAILRLEHTFDVSKLFQKEFVDVATVSVIIQKEMNLTQQYYIDPPDVDENELILDTSGYIFLREYGREKGFLFYLRGAIIGKKFFDIEIERDIFGMDLMRALEFQVSFSKKVITSLQERFVDNFILSELGVLVPAQHPILEKDLRDYDFPEPWLESDLFADGRLLPAGMAREEVVRCSCPVLELWWREEIALGVRGKAVVVG
ncbi:hypothetical protein GOP47_0022474 [Adiantum capillus-veneris]|uniref:Uncharacterized protein n=1 Tax=Adiantum capillus-veneris TaxID=13818 RepID=A0A9D4U6D4_ADICA|nr:hypothetical protein GOP47_0022474 [Adiantum capillus-veneris]